MGDKWKWSPLHYDGDGDTGVAHIGELMKALHPGRPRKSL